MLDDCEQRESKLSDWERKFIEDMQAKRGRGGSLTKNEDLKLEEIWNQVTA